MSNNTNQQTNNKQKKGVSFLSLLIAILIILAVIAGVYFALFPDKADIPFVSEEIENKINAFIKKPDNASETNSAQNDTENKGLLNSLQNSANEIFEKLSPEQPAKISPDQNAENNLAEHDMTPLVQQNNTFQENNAEEKTPEDFTLEPPSTITPLESGRKMLTEEEIALAQEKDKQEKLAKLEELRSNQLAPSAQDTAFPSKQGTLTSLVPDTSFDPVVSLFFIQDLADYLVNNYKTDADGQAVLTTSMPRINQRYGTGLMGLEHMKGRAGVLEYAYNANMLPVLYEHLSPALIRSMRQIAKQKTCRMPNRKKCSMPMPNNALSMPGAYAYCKTSPSFPKTFKICLPLRTIWHRKNAFLLKICSVLNKTGTTKIWRARLRKISNKAPYAPNSCVPA